MAPYKGRLAHDNDKLLHLAISVYKYMHIIWQKIDFSTNRILWLLNELKVSGSVTFGGVSVLEVCLHLM